MRQKNIEKLLIIAVTEGPPFKNLSSYLKIALNYHPSPPRGVSKVGGGDEMRRRSTSFPQDVLCQSTLGVPLRRLLSLRSTLNLCLSKRLHSFGIFRGVRTRQLASCATSNNCRLLEFGLRIILQRCLDVDVLPYSINSVIKC